MRRNLHWSVPLAILLGFAGLFVTKISFWLGALMILIGLVVSVMALRGSLTTTLWVPKPRARTQRILTTPEHPVHSGIDRQKLGVLRYTLHQANLDSSAPVFETRNKKIVTVRDVLVEMIGIAEAHGHSVEELAYDIVAMYPRIFGHVQSALRQYPDGARAKAYIARQAMTDLHWNVDE